MKILIEVPIEHYQKIVYEDIGALRKAVIDGKIITTDKYLDFDDGFLAGLEAAKTMIENKIYNCKE